MPGSGSIVAAAGAIKGGRGGRKGGAYTLISGRAEVHGGPTETDTAANGSDSENREGKSAVDSLPSCGILALGRHYTSGLRLFWDDGVLLGLAAVQFIAEFALHGFLGVTFSFLIGELHFTQDEAVLPGIVKKISQTVASALAMWLLPRTGQWAGATIGLFISAVGLLVYGVGSLCCIGQAGAFIGSFLLSFGIGITTPALLTATSWRVGACDQAKVQASLTLIGSLGISTGVVFHSRILHDATAEGIASRSLPMNVSACTFMVAAAVAGIVGYRTSWSDINLRRSSGVG